MTRLAPVMAKPIPRATNTMALWAAAPLMPVLLMALLLETLRAAWEVVETMAARNPNGSKVGLFHDAAPIGARAAWRRTGGRRRRPAGA